MDKSKMIIAAAAALLIAASVFFAGSSLFESGAVSKEKSTAAGDELTATSEEMSDDIKDEFSERAEKGRKEKDTFESTSLEGTCWSSGAKRVVEFSSAADGRKFALFYVSENGELLKSASYRYKEAGDRIIFYDINSDEIINKYDFKRSSRYIKIGEDIYRKDDFGRYDAGGE